MPEGCPAPGSDQSKAIQEQEVQNCQDVAEYPPAVYPPDHPCCELPDKECTCQDVTAVASQDADDGPLMGPIGPWATGRVDWGPLAGLTGTRPVVDRYSITRYSNDEWRNHNADLANRTASNHHNANQVDFTSRQAVDATVACTDKVQLDSTKLLQQRAHEVHRWKTLLERAALNMAEEVNSLEGQRQRLKAALRILRTPESIAGECLERRTARLEPDLVRDQVEEELIKEVALVSEVGSLMQQMLKRTEEQLAVNKSAKQRVECDWSDKKEAYAIETTNIGLRNTSADILFHPGATCFSESQSTPETWERHSSENLGILEAELEKSKELRLKLDMMLTDMSRDLRTQADNVDSALSRRIAETNEALRYFENDLMQTLDHIAKTEKLIVDLKTAIRAQDMPMKVVQTRLQNRLVRPGAENCRDMPQYGLVNEVKTISTNVSGLLGQLKQAESTLQVLLKDRSDLERSILVKRKTLSIDRDRCRELRSHYPSSVALTGY